jgi:hypothetical protein
MSVDLERAVGWRCAGCCRRRRPKKLAPELAPNGLKWIDMRWDVAQCRVGKTSINSGLLRWSNVDRDEPERIRSPNFGIGNVTRG